MAFRNYYPNRPAIPSSEITEKTLQTLVDDNGVEIVNVVDTPIPDELPDYQTTSLDALKSAGVIPEKVSPYVLNPTISMSESSKKSE